jgi:hypothetical protein
MAGREDKANSETEDSVQLLVSTASDDMIARMPSLSKTNPYLRDAGVRQRIVAENARESSHFEGARGLPALPHRSDSPNRRETASTKNAVKGS